jgi:hypothetical protein
LAKISAYINQIPVVSQNENIGIGIGGRYVVANILVLAKISAGMIYQYRYWLDPYRSNPSHYIQPDMPKGSAYTSFEPTNYSHPQNYPQFDINLP